MEEKKLKYELYVNNSDQNSKAVELGEIIKTKIQLTGSNISFPQGSGTCCLLPAGNTAMSCSKGLNYKNNKYLNIYNICQWKEHFNENLGLIFY